MFGPTVPERAIAVFGAFFDDSGTHAGSPVVAMGGLLGTAEQWDVFATAWSERLASPLPGKTPLKQFHLSPCRAGDGEFRDYNQAERDHLTYLFRRIILDIDFVTVAAAADKMAWDEFSASYPNVLGDPLEYCFVKCVDTIVDVIRRHKPWEKVYIFFDQATRPHLVDFAKLYLMQTEKYPELDGFSFAPVAKVVALQGADMIATETYQYGQEWLREGRGAVANPHFREFLSRELSAGFIIDREMIAEMVERMRR